MAIHSAMRKYGLPNFKIIVLHKTRSREEASVIERALIKILKTQVPNGYNIGEGGDNGASRRGFTVPPETRAKMSAAAKGKKKSPEHIVKMRIGLTGRKCSAAHVEIIRRSGLANRGKKRTYLEKLRQNIYKRKAALSTSPNSASGLRCVGWDMGAWIVRLHHQGKKMYIGRFKSKEVAFEAYRAKATMLLAEMEAEYRLLTGHQNTEPSGNEMLDHEPQSVPMPL